MSRIACFSRPAVNLKNLNGSHARTLSFLSPFSTSASEPTAPDSQPQPLPYYAPPPVGVALSKDAGRAIFAARRILAGEIITTAKPMISHPSLSLLDRVCYYCLRRVQKGDNSSESSQTVCYCSESCEELSKMFYDLEKKADWSRFHEYCRLQGLKYPLLVKRYACRVITGNIPSGLFNILQPETLSPEKIALMKEEFGLLRSTLEDADIDSEKMSFLTEEWYIDVLARMRINAFRVELPLGSYEDLHSSAAASVEAVAAVGNAIYMLPSFYNHDCDPNMNVVWVDNAEMKIKALRDIEEEEECRICYLDASMGYEARQKILYEGYGFKCNCSRCVAKE